MRKDFLTEDLTNDEVEVLAHTQLCEKMEYEAQKDEELWEQELEKELWEEQLQREYHYKQKHRNT